MGYLLIPLSTVYLEIFNAFASQLTGKVYNFAGAVFMCLALGFVLDIIVSIFPVKAQKGIAFIIIELLTVFFLIEHFTDTAYSAFMSPASIAEGAGGVATGFGDVVIDIIKGNIVQILIAHIPAFIALIICFIKGAQLNIKRGKMTAIGLALAAVFTGSLSAECCNKLQTEAYSYGYNYDNAVRNFGVANAVYLDARYAALGIPDAPAFDLEGGEIKEAAPREIIYEPHEMAIDFDSLIAGNSSVYKDMLTYVSGLTPALQNEYTGLFAGKNLILITGETFVKELVREDVNPTIYRLATQGIVVNDFYHPAWGGSTTSGEASILMGVIATEGVKTIQKAIGKDNSYTLASRFRALPGDYYVKAMHDGDQLFYNRPKTHPALGFSDYIACGKGMKITIDLWPRSDLEMMEYSVPLYSGGENFFVYYMTVSGHCRYTWAGNNMSKKHKETIQALLPDASDAVQAFYACNYDLELAMAKLLEQLEASGHLDDTVIVMTGDHYPYALVDGPTYNNPVNYLEELYGYYPNRLDQRDHNTLIIWSKELEDDPEKIVIDEPCYTPDMLPTLLNLFGFEYDSRLFVGRDILGDEPGLVIWPNGSFKTEKGFYNAGNGQFYDRELTVNKLAAETDTNYINYYKQIVREKINYSRNFINNDLYKILDLTYKEGQSAAEFYYVDDVDTPTAQTAKPQ